MTRDELASHFDMVRYKGTGFTARCPAHADTKPSLTVKKGRTSWLVTCWAGCRFFDIAAAAGLSPIAFKLSGSNGMAPAKGSNMDAARRLKELVLATRHVKHTVFELIEEALDVPAGRMRELGEWYPTWKDLSLPQALKMRHVFFDTVIWDVLGKERRRNYGRDWFEAKDTVEELLWLTYKAESSALME